MDTEQEPPRREVIVRQRQNETVIVEEGAFGQEARADLCTPCIARADLYPHAMRVLICVPQVVIVQEQPRQEVVIVENNGYGGQEVIVQDNGWGGNQEVIVQDNGWGGNQDEVIVQDGW